MTEEQFKALIAKGSPQRSNVKSIIKDLVKQYQKFRRTRRDIRHE